MLKENGKVVAVDDQYAWVRVVRRSACDACQATACGQKTLSMMLNQKTADIPLSNALDCAVGDDVVIGIPEVSLLKLSILTYLLPLLFMILFAGIGAFAVSWSALSSDLIAGFEVDKVTDLVSVLCGLGGLFAGFVGVRKKSRTLEKDDSFQPILLSRNPAELRLVMTPRH